MSTYADWVQRNQAALVAELRRIGECLEKVSESPGLTSADSMSMIRTASAGEPDSDAAFAILAQTFLLSGFERDLLLLAAGVQLDAGIRDQCIAIQGDAAPTLNLAMSAFDDAHWSALSPNGPLRYWQLVTLGAGASIATRPIYIDETVLNYLVGVRYLDPRLCGILRPIAPSDADLLDGQARAAERAATNWSGRTAAPPILNLHSADPTSRLLVAAAVGTELEYSLYRMSAQDVPARADERDALARLWQREAALGDAGLFLEIGESDRERTHGACSAFLGLLGGLVIVGSKEAMAADTLEVSRIEVPAPGSKEQLTAWLAELGEHAAMLNGELEAVVQQFDLSAEDIRVVGRRIRTQSGNGDPERTLWHECRRQARARLDGLAQRIRPAATFDDIVLPEHQLEQLKQIGDHVRHRSTVYNDWGFAEKCTRGLGITALFAGPSGTGKTMAAEVLANELELDLYRIDLSQVVSKYIGETEKNLARVFDCAQSSGCILLFDEADALFGKRGEVRDSHDRFANVEISYLLQRMEEYRGLAILTTNMKDALDKAFLRRIRFVIAFPFPGATLRAEIWKRVFPEHTPVGDIDVRHLSHLDVAGGNIRNIAMNAAFIAASKKEPIDRRHICTAVAREYEKLQRPLTKLRSENAQ